MVQFLSPLLPSAALLLSRLRFALLTATVLMVLGLNHQAVATLRVLPAPAEGAHVAAAPRAAVVKQRVTFEATATLGLFVAPSPDAWLPAPVPVPTVAWRAAELALPRLRPGTAPNVFSTRLLGTCLSPHAP